MLSQGQVDIRIRRSEYLEGYAIIEFRQAPLTNPLHVFLTHEQLTSLAEALKGVEQDLCANR